MADCTRLHAIALSMIVQAVVGALGGIAILVAGLILLDVRFIIMGAIMLPVSLYGVYYWFRRL